MVMTRHGQAAATAVHCFRIGEVEVSLQGDLREAVEEFSDLYRACRRDPAHVVDPIQMRVRRAAGWSLRRKPYVVDGDGQKMFSPCRAEEVLPFIEWGINWRLVERQRRFLQLHAAAVAHAETGVLLAADSGSGKSTLSAGLLARGWTYLSDEFGLIDPQTLHLHPYPKALCIKAGAFGIVEKLGLPLWRGRHYVKAFKGCVGYVNPHDVSPQPAPEPVPIRFVIFPHYDGRTEPQLNRIPRAEATFRLAACTLNRSLWGERGITALNDITCQAECYRLDSGGLTETCDLLEQLISRES